MALAYDSHDCGDDWGVIEHAGHGSWRFFRMNPVRDLLKSGKTVVGTAGSLYEDTMAMLADSGLDVIRFALDLGARGIIVPMVNTKQEAEAMVRACLYTPLGERSNAGVRGEWGETTDYRAYLDTVNAELLIIPMIETQQAIDNIDEILSVGRIDVLLVGPSDLSIELGVPLQYASDTYQAGLDNIAAACKNHGVVPGMYFIPPDMDP